ncbi:hypothetical protein N656DRAFT_703977 [Canariomyces notabilis]|uniref:Uncharacterized protein n=1 Tax=Canariomyces notabilis TaxID=2074819 RepID=A0AAN6YW12_9PEZI|nr:hypothetical protein N656DRAFT_703977 [Canariomyces arenarius]
MAPSKSPQKGTQTTEEGPDVIELSSDSEPEVFEIEDEADEEPEEAPSSPDVNEQPLLKAAGIRYRTNEVEDGEPQQNDEPLPQGSSIAVRVKDAGSVKHRHVSIEIPLPTSSELRRRQAKASASSSQEKNEGDVFKTPKEKRQHITFDDSDHDEQAAALKRKRQARDALLKRQAEERKRAQRPAGPEDASNDAGPSEQDATEEHSDKRKRSLPKLLPLELLESDDEDDISQRPSPALNGKHKRMKLGGPEQSLLREPRLPRDQRVGSTVFRVVAGNGNATLAPKARQQARNLKETLLRRDRVPQARGGFFVKKR